MGVRFPPGAQRKLQISKSKFQINHNLQIQNFQDRFGIWELEFGIFRRRRIWWLWCSSSTEACEAFSTGAVPVSHPSRKSFRAFSRGMVFWFNLWITSSPPKHSANLSQSSLGGTPLDKIYRYAKLTSRLIADRSLKI